MKSADLASAQKIVADRVARKSMCDRLKAGEHLAVTLGEGANVSRIVLADAYAQRLRADLVAAFEKQIADADDALRQMGVEP